MENSVPSNHVLRERKETIEHLKILYQPITFGVSEKRLRGSAFFFQFGSRIQIFYISQCFFFFRQFMVHSTDGSELRLAQVPEFSVGTFGTILLFAALVFKTSYIPAGFLLPHWVAVPYLRQLSPGYGEFTLSAVTILMLNCPFDIADQEDLVEDIVQAPIPGYQITTFALIQRFVVARAETTSQGDQSIIASSGGPNIVSGRLHGKQHLISIKSAVVLCGRLVAAVEFENR
ncbi:hypothetical protein T07_3781 [Trichinella nelsoni]|uniref:Uncharacterized protein n=1 Tax=Trichinella nelsoni TaxID=6336 RepID=A0A0V0S2Q6_9BILA|nr:hypothetical protein T07_3781 [Trichinella nelsoni]